ncbi:Ankyrin repeat domain-containing protein 50 [Durusdinium trenchii]|uniref:Ankyrin repeat domain-containing protein 50 n=1 Tax=Durusdinium trenchii TaxID=1381693 RepID=A0ABP0RTE1_9DINO
MPLGAASAIEVALPRPPTKMRLLSPELRSAIEEKQLATKRAAKTAHGEPAEQDVIREARKIESQGGVGGHGAGHGPWASSAPGYGAQGAYGPHAGAYGYGSQRGWPGAHGPPRQRFAHPGQHLHDGPRGVHHGRAASAGAAGPGQAQSNNGQMVDVVPWNGRMEEGPCDPESVFEVRAKVRDLAPHLLSSGCEKYVMDADKMLNNLPTDFASDMVPACKNDYLVKSAAKTVYDVERCAQVAMARAEHMNEEDKVEMEKILDELRVARTRVLVPVNGYASPASFPGHAHMSAKEWREFDHSGSAGQSASHWGKGPHSLPQSGHHHGFGGGAPPMGDSYGHPPQPAAPFHPGGPPPGMMEADLTPKQQEIRDAIVNAQKLAKDKVDKEGYMRVGPIKTGPGPMPPAPKMPVFQEPGPSLDNSEVPVHLPVWSKDQLVPPAMAMCPWLACSALAFLEVPQLKPGRRRRFKLAVDFFG